MLPVSWPGPVFIDADVRLGRALAILEYLEEPHPESPLLPKSSAARAHARELAPLSVADTQPLQNTGPFSCLADPLGVSDPDRFRWYRHWVSRGLGVFERIQESRFAASAKSAAASHPLK